MGSNCSNNDVPRSTITIIINNNTNTIENALPIYALPNWKSRNDRLPNAVNTLKLMLTVVIGFPKEP